jgi:hypothetical protein
LIEFKVQVGQLICVESAKAVQHCPQERRNFFSRRQIQGIHQVRAASRVPNERFRPSLIFEVCPDDLGHLQGCLVLGVGA